MQLRLDAADRLVELVEERRGPVLADEAARRLFALRHAPVGLARSLLDEVVVDDARLAWRGDAVGLSDPPGATLALERATYVVVDLETTGLRPGTSRICEIGAVRVRDLELTEDLPHVRLDGVLAQVHLPCDLPVGEALADQAQDLELRHLERRLSVRAQGSWRIRARTLRRASSAQ